MLTNKPDDSGSLRKKVLKGVAERAKIHGLIGWHSLCHSYRAWLDETGAPLGEKRSAKPTRQCAARAASRPHQIAKGRLLWTASVLAFSSL